MPHHSWRTFVRLLGFLRPYRASLIVSSILAIASQITGILVPVLAGVVIDAETPTRSSSCSKWEQSSRSGSSAEPSCTAAG